MRQPSEVINVQFTSTSKTTGLPQAVELSHCILVNSAHAPAKTYQQLTPAEEPARAMMGHISTITALSTQPV